ncbi:MAG: hydrolase TatD [Bdellovibrio sp. CG12_big_fil_rev_8_21_14_0_65_39_13]|nr:MAG: hydrolase TatD [Bdellovibrio sp. CG22_combo_CG10-13_8_21_14_all_39_27]PIQ58147.1 MAG: hydrolase TatD [Bdellovibrio sp. CG12_big_fil_rev_8_21_14_0_65_39_13]PIR34309.1 MAG: hydrolase TatD [Bdellovibrio sp. CG11_big_fil_rev_8_21_14_0_20_39_38]PJB53215.1 MAG: TatD family deoxyribonuclease [Bdellovibrio sp. CG_4_9_14_3_um_filter_39_7]
MANKIVAPAPLPIIETHFHLDYLKASSAEEILQRAKLNNVQRFITIAVHPDNLSVVRDLSKRFPEVYFTQGIHPHDAKLVTTEVLNEIREAKSYDRCVAIGEIGLDYHYDNSPRDIQCQAFKDQLLIACELDLPVVIHTREAEDDTLEILKSVTPKLHKRGVLHSFTSKPELARWAVSQGYYLGFNGIITFKTAHEVRDVVAETPLTNILLETDAPFLTPHPHRGVENSPYYLPLIAQKIAEIKQITVEEVLATCFENSERLFFN